MTEKNWAIVNKIENAYSKSKPLAEKAAWDFVKELPGEQNLIGPMHIQELFVVIILLILFMSRSNKRF